MEETGISQVVVGVMDVAEGEMLGEFNRNTEPEGSERASMMRCYLP